MIYLDHHAATPLAPGVREVLIAAHDHGWANPSSAHAAGRAARAQVEEARRALAAAIGARPADLVFASGGTEACRLGVHGLVGAARTPHVITSALEHPAIVGAVEQLAERGARVEHLALEGGLPPSVEALADALRPETALVALQWVNHETGAIAPVEGYARVCRERSVPLLVDGCQALGKLPCDVRALGATAVAFAASKIGGPSGAAALWLDRAHALTPVQRGGGQERGRRGGTPDVAALAGFGAAARALPARSAAMERVGALRDRLERALVALGAVVNGGEAARVGTACNVSVRGWRGAVLVAALDVEGLACSAGAACSSGLDAPSPVLAAMYPDAPWRAESALRLSLGPETSEGEVEQAIAILARVLRRAP